MASPVANRPVCTGTVFQEMLYDPLPPVTESVALPVRDPKQVSLIVLSKFACNAAAGWLMMTLRVKPHALAFLVAGSVEEQQAGAGIKSKVEKSRCVGVLLGWVRRAGTDHYYG